MIILSGSMRHTMEFNPWEREVPQTLYPEGKQPNHRRSSTKKAFRCPHDTQFAPAHQR